jgi:DNA-binding MarR family transcriptional regulator
VEGDEQLPNLLLRTARLLVDRARAGDPTGLAVIHVVAAHYVAEHAEVTTSALARHLKVTKQSASELVQALEAEGIVERAPHPRDGRAHVLLLTESGRARLAEGRRRWEALEEEWVELVGRERVEVVREVLRTYLDAHAVTPA